MQLQQLRYLCEIERQGLSFSGAARALHVSQPGISKQIRLLEEELKVNFFIRKGNRILELTEPGRRISELANLVLRGLDDVKGTASEFMQGDTGILNVAATFTFARYVLPRVFRSFAERYPKVQLRLQQGSPDFVSQITASGIADIALTTYPAQSFPDLLMLDYCKLPRVLVTPRDHPLLLEKHLTLKLITTYPLISLDPGSQGQSKMRDTFRKSGLEPYIAFTGVDVDVVKAFVEEGVGIAILPAISVSSKRDARLCTVDVGHLLQPHSGCLALRKNHYPRGFAFEFMHMLAPRLDRRTVERALSGARIQ